ncbi:MAG: nucleoside recognition domain-containing protein [Syntrophomonadales bacterium]|jgi:spore maturation protein A
MLNYIWLALLLSGIVVAALNGNIEVVTQAALKSANDAVQICISLIGIMCLWLGIMRIGEKAGLIEALSRLVRPIMVKLFPSIPSDHPALGAIIMNLSANILGLGSAATPFGLKAMQEMQKLNSGRKEASEAMCTFLALNTSCITLIPATIIAVRVNFNSANPTEIVGATIFATCCSMTLAIVADYMFRRANRRRMI